MSRQINDIQNKETGQLVYPRTHAQAVMVNSTETLDATLTSNDLAHTTLQTSINANTTSINGKQDKITIVDHGTSDTTFTLTPNVLHKWGTVTKLTLTLGGGTTGVANYYMFQFTSGSTATTLSVPATVKWSGGELNIEANKTYQVSILDNCAVMGGF